MDQLVGLGHPRFDDQLGQDLGFLRLRDGNGNLSFFLLRTGVLGRSLRLELRSQVARGSGFFEDSRLGFIGAARRRTRGAGEKNQDEERPRSAVESQGEGQRRHPSDSTIQRATAKRPERDS